MPRRAIPPQDLTTTPRKTPTQWDASAASVIEVEMKKARCSYEELTNKLAQLGFDTDSAKNLQQRIERGTFSFAFALRVLRTLGIDNLDLSYVVRFKKPPGYVSRSEKQRKRPRRTKVPPDEPA